MDKLKHIDFSKLIRMITPGFLRRIDQHLLVRYPLIWRTKVHYFAWYSLLLGNALLFLLGYLYPVSRTDVPTASQVDTLVAGLRLIGGLGLLIWAYVQYRINLGERQPRQYVVTGVIYALCIFSVLCNPLSFMVPVVQSIAAVTPDVEFAEEYAFHEGNNFWCCDKDEELTEEKAAQYEGEIGNALEKYGFARGFRYSEDSFYRDGYLCEEQTPCLIFTTSTDGLGTSLFRGRLNSIREAKAFLDISLAKIEVWHEYK